MVSFGLIEEWNPRPGRLTSWVATPAAVAEAACADVHPVPASHQQEEYLRAAWRNESAGFRFSRLCLISFDIQAPLDRAALTAALNEFLRRHDTFRSWFSVEPDGRVVRHVVEPETVEVAAVDHGAMTSAAQVREHVQAETPGPRNWDCFTFGAIEWDGGFTLYCAVDHLNTDGMSQAMTCVDLMTLYMNHAFGTQNPLAPVGSYVDYCRREREISRTLTRESPQVQRWVDLISANGGRLPQFPLPLGKDVETYTRSAHLTTTVFDEAAAQRFEEVCLANGANVTAGLMATAALAYAEFTGQSDYLGMTPKSTRRPGPELSSVGWFTSLIPVPVEVGTDTTFTTAAAIAGRSYGAGKELTDVSFHRVLELVRPEDGISVEPGWSVPMISYVDVRKLPGVEMFDAINGCLYGNRGSSEEVFMWINRFQETTSMTFLFPDTEIGHASVHRYTEKYIEIMTAVANQGDYEPVVAALT
ncbi:condensation domain-containing protein [Gordonia insulae]|uniref:Trehalose-2-sulfate acyltransferase papA2 n=1 Tax=Gordonia insulae TaxID=2420509 RepID=A0A3G8JHH2_9ACTN|nr:condensation domain-containing protein [Gordonia insulae]AZG44045.1 Trehalose-2-sulfate acyltransferase papA2 [Gordonia insulae]